MAAFTSFVTTYDRLLPHRSKMKFVVTEFGSVGIPQALRQRYLVAGARKLISHSRCIHAVGYTTMSPGVDGERFLGSLPGQQT
jgi:hypothetical protein